MSMWTAIKNCRNCFRAKYATFVVWEEKAEPACSIRAGSFLVHKKTSVFACIGEVKK